MTTISIVGGGSVGRAVGRGLHDAGWNVAAVVTRSRRSAAEAVRVIGGGRAFDTLTRLVLEADVVLVATPETEIGSTATELARLGGEEWRRKTVLHTACTLNRSALAPLERWGAAAGSMKPVQLFGRRTSGNLDGIFFVVEGSGAAVRVARRIVRTLGGLPIEVQSEKKSRCGVMGEMVTAQVLALVSVGARLLIDAGFSRRQGSRAVLDLTRAALMNFERYGGAGAGNAATPRRDRKIAAEHARVLAGYPREFAAAYRAAERLGALAFSRGANEHEFARHKRLDRRE